MGEGRRGRRGGGGGEGMGGGGTGGGGEVGGLKNNAPTMVPILWCCVVPGCLFIQAGWRRRGWGGVGGDSPVVSALSHGWGWGWRRGVLWIKVVWSVL